MSVTAIDIDDSLLSRAREVLGTTTKKDTVNEALRRVVRSREVDELWALFDSGAMEIEDHKELRRRASKVEERVERFLR